MKYKPISPRNLNTYSIKKRNNKVSVKSFSLPYKKGGLFKSFTKGLPDFLAVKDITSIVGAIVKAYKNNRPVILGMGAHPIKVGLSPIIIDLMNKKIITAIATNGASIIHDFEIAFSGQTSEEVVKEIQTGRFGMVKETGKLLNNAINDGVKNGLGIGQSIGKFIEEANLPYKEKSIFRMAYISDIPITVHIAIGSDIIHIHRQANGAFIGTGSLQDFRLLTSVIADIEGGVYINLGSAVILPEVFLKALSMARNLGHKVKNFTTVNMDIIQHYRPSQNVLYRPTIGGGQCFAITGHHEIMFPLLAAMIIEEI